MRLRTVSAFVDGGKNALHHELPVVKIREKEVPYARIPTTLNASTLKAATQGNGLCDRYRNYKRARAAHRTMVRASS